MRILIILLTALFISACGSQPGRPSDHIIEQAHSGGSTLAISPDSRTLASGGWSGNIRLWDLKSGKDIGKWKAHTDSVNGIFFLPNNRILSVGYDGKIAIWNRQGGAITTWHTTPITAADVRLKKDLLVTGHKNGSLTEWSISKQSATKQHQPHRKLVRDVTISPDNSSLASSSRDGRVAITKRKDSSIRYLDKASSDTRTLAFSSDGERLYGGGWFDLFKWNVSDGKLKTIETDHKGIINSIQFMPNGQLASISRQTDSAVLLLDPISGKTGTRLQQHDLCGVAVNVSPDGRFVTTTSDDASVRIWDLSKGK
jgi:WD40 repeat protein